MDNSRGAKWINQSVPLPRWIYTINLSTPRISLALPGAHYATFWNFDHQVEPLISDCGQGNCQDGHSRGRGQPNHEGASYCHCDFLVCHTQIVYSSIQGARSWTSGHVGLTWSRILPHLLAVNKHTHAKRYLERETCLPCAGARKFRVKTLHHQKSVFSLLGALVLRPSISGSSWSLRMAWGRMSS